MENKENSKTIYLIRHGQSTFNAEYIDENYDPFLFDARLTDIGRDQAKSLRTLINSTLHDVELIVSSPLSRAIDTARIAFAELLDNRKELKIKIIKHHSEYLCDSDDNGRPLSEIRLDFPDCDFEELNEEHWWYIPDHLKSNQQYVINYQEHFRKKRYREPYEDLKQRFKEFKQWLSERTERKIVVVGHSDFYYYLFEEEYEFLNNCQVMQWDMNSNETKLLN